MAVGLFDGLFFNGLGFGRRIESLAGEFDKSLERENDVVDGAAAG